MSEWPTKPGPPRHPTSVGEWPARRRSARPLWPQLLQLLAIILFVIGGYHLALWVWGATAPKEVSVPAVIGLPQQEALRLVKSAGLRPEVAEEKPSEEAPENTILACDPPARRRVKVGRVVRLTLSTGSKWAKAPDVRDMSVDRARTIVREAKLVPGKETARYHDKVPIGYVMEQAPAPGEKVLRNSEVELVVSRGPKPPMGVVGGEPPREGTRSSEISILVPPGASLQEVRMMVRDRKGERVVYTGYHQPGETVTRTVSGEGPSIVVQVYLSGILVQERSI